MDSSQECDEAMEQDTLQEGGEPSLVEQEPTYAEVVSGAVTRSRAKKLNKQQ